MPFFILRALKFLLKIGIKYCGGCNPAYDRVTIVQHLSECLEGKATFVSPQSTDLDIILAIQGCPTACADLTAFEGRPVRILTNREDAEAFAREVKNGDAVP